MARLTRAQIAEGVLCEATEPLDAAEISIRAARSGLLGDRGGMVPKYGIQAAIMRDIKERKNASPFLVIEKDHRCRYWLRYRQLPR